MAAFDCIPSRRSVRHLRVRLRSLSWAALWAGVACAGAGSAPRSRGPLPTERNAFVRQLDEVVPSFLERSGVPGGAVALVRNGEVVMLRGYGLADREQNKPVTATTVFNVGSISKTVTAWGIMRLVEQKKIGLDDPVERYLRRWHLPASRWNPDGVTLRRLLSHSAGLSLPSVHEYRPSERMPALWESLADSAEGVRQIAEPGSGFAYSGGGYELLQLLIEDVTGQPFAQFMRDQVLVPLGMRNSTFDTLAVSPTRMATPYDSGHAIAAYRYLGLAAAGLYSTAEDLARFVAAGMRGARGELPGRGVLSPTSVQTMLTPAISTGFGFHYGFGYNLFPLGNTLRPERVLGDGALAPGHMGQNTGWGAVMWSNPATGDGFVMLTNHSAGYQAYRWALCDWVRWVSLPSFGYICDGREKQMWGQLGRTLYAQEIDSSPHLPFVDSLARSAAADTAPGMAILVMQDGRIAHLGGYGRADLATRARITQDTPFYLASLSKQFTAMAIMRLVREGALSYDDPLSRFMPELGATSGAVTVKQLLTHSSGIPNYYDFIRDWSRLKRINNTAVLDTLRGKSLDFEPGSRAKYSNSNYVLLATIVERLTKQRFAEAMKRLVFEPAGLRSATVLDDSAAFPHGRAVGYERTDGRFTMSDYGVIETEAGRRVYFDMRTVGAGGMYGTLRDFVAWEEALASTRLLTRQAADEAFRSHVTATDAPGVDSLVGYGYGWIASKRYGTDVAWHDGAMAGFRNVMLRVPSRRFSVVVLSNASWIDQRRLAVAIADHYLSPNP